MARKQPLKLTSKLFKKADYPMNWIMTAYPEDNDNYIKFVKMHHDNYDILMGNLNEVLHKLRLTINPRNVDIFISVFRDKMTFEETGNMYNLSKTRVGEIIRKVSRILRCNDNFNYILYGKEYFNIVNSEKERKENFDIFTNQISTRAYIILRRMGIDSLDDISKHTLGDFYYARNCGILTLRELLTKFKEYNITLKKQTKYDKYSRNYIRPKMKKELEELIIEFFGSYENI